MLHWTSGEVSTLSRWPEGIVTPMQYQVLWGVSSVGRAFAWHAKGQRFDPVILHQVLWAVSDSGSTCALQA